jgi:plastocyanin
MRRRRLTPAFGSVLGILALVLLASSAQAKVWTVNITGFAFSPQGVTISEGDSVKWVNLDPTPHTSTSDTGLWTSGNLAQNGTYEREFSANGSFPYHCALHPSMHGTVNVTSVATSRETWGRVKRLYKDR